MAFNALEYLRDGNVDFVFHATSYDYKNLIKNVRKAPNRIEIINGFLPELKEKLPLFCFDVIYDIPEFMDTANELLDINRITPEMLNNLLNNSPLGIKILYEYLDMFLSSSESEKYFEYIVKYAFESNNTKLIHILSRYKDLHIRYLFMFYLIKNHNEMIDIIYDDITKYTTSVTYDENDQLTFLPELMEVKDISSLAVLLLTNNREKDYQKLKEFILKDYKYNYLASKLLEYEFPDNPYKTQRENAFNEDADELFKTSDNRFYIYLSHKAKISQELIDDFAHRIRYFLEHSKNSNEWGPLSKIYCYHLGSLLEEWSEKYMDLSKNKEYGFIGGGSTCDCYRIGDYVIKLVSSKWSYEDIICPNLYLITKNYEEIYLRDKHGIVRSGLEVQKYLTRKSNNIDSKYFIYFDRALNELGYTRTDTLINGVCGDNTMLLDTYRDADCKDPEKVPDWFKECPLVLVDRDNIFPKDKPYIKQLISRY